MANQTLNRPIGNGEPAVATLLVEFATTTNGAVGAVARAQGLRTTTPIVRNSAGNYDLFLKEAWIGGLVYATITVISSAITAAKAYDFHVVSKVTTGATPKIVIAGRRSDTIAAADVPDGASIQVALFLKNAS